MLPVVVGVGTPTKATFHPPSPRGPHSHQLLVDVAHGALRASATVYLVDPSGDGLPEFFEKLAEDWRGWDGERRWVSLEGELAVGATNDRRGHCSFTIEVQDGLDPNWTLVLQGPTVGAGEDLAEIGRSFARWSGA